MDIQGVTDAATARDIRRYVTTVCLPQSLFPVACHKTMSRTINFERNVLMDQRIAEVFSAVFEVSAERVTDSLSPQDVTGWDSLGHVRLVTQLQEQFGLEFEVDEIMRMENVAEIKKILAAKLV